MRDFELWGDPRPSPQRPVEQEQPSQSYDIDPFSVGQQSPWAAPRGLWGGPAKMDMGKLERLAELRGLIGADVSTNLRNSLNLHGIDIVDTSLKPKVPPKAPEIPPELLDDLLERIGARKAAAPKNLVPKSNSQMSRLKRKAVSAATLFGARAELLKQQALLAGDQLKARTKMAIAKPGMMTGRMPTFRGAGAGVMDMFMKGPEWQKAISDPLYGAPPKKKKRIEDAWTHGT